jgi:hypothetical protein
VRGECGEGILRVDLLKARPRKAGYVREGGGEALLVQMLWAVLLKGPVSPGIHGMCVLIAAEEGS